MRTLKELYSALDQVNAQPFGRWRAVTRWLQTLSGPTQKNLQRLPSNIRMRYLRVEVRLVRPFRAWLFRVRNRLDAPPKIQLVPGAPVTREGLITVLRTAGPRFAREYWTEGVGIVVPGAGLGQIPDEFLYPPRRPPPPTATAESDAANSDSFSSKRQRTEQA